jgi:hypothetical protein
MSTRTSVVMLTTAAIAVGCTGGKGKGDTFVAGGSQIASWAATGDGRVKVPLAAGISWGSPDYGSGSTLLKVRGETGPTFIVVAEVEEAPKPLSLMTCAKAHGDQIARAVNAAGIFISPPMLSEETRKGERVPRVHYVVPLHAAAGVRGAATMSWWTYFLDGNRCVAVGVTSLVHEKQGDPNSPDPEDLHRMERIFSLLMDSTIIGG